MRVCDFCGKPIAPAESWVPFVGGEWHDTPDCLGNVQQAVTTAIDDAKKQPKRTK